MNDVARIEEFLNKIKYFAMIHEITENNIYANLIHMGVDNRKNIENMFQSWQEYFKDNDNIKVFVSDDWSYFCQFVSLHETYPQAYNKIKIYIPLDETHIEEGAKRIFTYLANNNMAHRSKIGKHIRFDDIVIRVNDFETLNKIRNYIMNDTYIREGLLTPNPFTFNDGMLAYAWDGRLSFNTVTANYIASYINALKRENKLDMVSYMGFLSYVKSVYDDVFVKQQNSDYYLQMMNVNLNNLNYEKANVLKNYGDVTKLLLFSLMPDKKMTDFVKMTNDIVHSYYGNNDLITYIYDALYAKYHDYEQVGKILMSYFKTGNIKLFTRDANGINVRQTVSDGILSKDRMKLDFINNSKRKLKRDILMEAVNKTLNKYNIDQAVVALKRGHIEGYFRNFTNDAGARDMVAGHIFKGEIMFLMQETLLENGYNADDISFDIDILCKQYLEKIQEKNNELSQGTLHNGAR